VSVAVVTGGTGGVGRAVVRQLADRGFDVAVLARGAAGLEATRRDVEDRGHHALALEVDVSDHAAVQAAASEVEDILGPIDVWVNDAMTTVFAPATHIDPADFRRAVEVTFLGQVWGTLVALERMQPRDAGTIVNVGSALAFIGIPLQAPYCAAKFACRGFTESVRAELLHEGSRVRLSIVHLPAVNTPQFDWCEVGMDRQPQPVAPIYEPEVAAAAIVASALDGRRSKVVGVWNKLLVAAGSVAPGIGNHFAAIAAWDAQLTDEPLAPGRRPNLREPVDDERDHGARGRFSDQAHGMFTASYLRTLPRTAVQFVRAVGTSAFDHRPLSRPAWLPASGPLVQRPSTASRPTEDSL
jgi:NAD(P)-dependent dehydrogenase (short-subunit alcohol dehydrogenase family)